MGTRRFRPDSDSLESRELLTSAIPTTDPALVSTAEDLTFARRNSLFAVSDEQVERRINRFRTLFVTLSDDRTVDPQALGQIEQGLVQIAGQLFAPAVDAIGGFNLALRNVLSTENLLPNEQRSLEFAFGQVLASAGAEAETILQLQEGLFQQARVNASAPVSGPTTAQDYALTLQTALGVGRRPPGLVAPR